LRSANGTDGYGQKMLDTWERYDRAPPFGMATAMGSIIVERPLPEPTVEPAPEGGTERDAGGATEPSPEGGRVDAGRSPEGGSRDGSIDAPVDDGAGGGETGCACSLAVAQGASYQASFGFSLFGLIGLLGHSRARPRRRRFK
jgi:hypothetical protein